MRTLPTDRPPSRALLASAIGLALASTTAFGQQSSPAAEIVVTGQAPSAEPTSSKFTAPLLETPKSVVVISQALIAATGATSLVDALRTVPGITFNAGEGGQPAGDNLKIRGFDAGADVFIDGLRDAGSQTRDVFALEQIEVVKGPGSAYSGRGSSGGSVNLATKKPSAADFVVADFGAGSDGYGRAALDTNFRLGDSVGFRLNVLAQDFDVPGRNEVGGSHRGVAPSFAFGMNTDTRMNLDFYRYETDDTPDYSIPYTRNAANTAPAGEPVATDRDNFYGLLDRDFQRTDADVRTFQIVHTFAKGLTLSNVTRYGRTTNDYIVTNPDDGRGNIVNGLIYRSPKSRNSVSTTTANATSIVGRAKTGRIEHSYAAGVELGDEAMTNTPYVITTAFAGNAVTAFSTSCSAPGAVAASGFNCTSLSNPNPNDPWVGTITASTTPTSVATDTRAVYGFDTLNFNKHWALNLGLRWDDYDTEQNGFVANVPQVLRNKADFWNYTAGLVLKPTVHSNVYLSTGTSSSPSGNTLGDGTENLATTNQDLAPERDRTYEFGVKWELGARLALTTAVFRTETANARAAVTGGLQELIGDELVRGFEVGLSGNITNRWQMFTSFAFLDSKIVDDGPIATNEGKAFPNTPRNSFSLWTSYAVSQRVTIGGGANYVDERFGNVANTVWIPDYWRYDAMAAFSISRKVNLQVNVQNLTNETYFVRPYQNHYASLGPARSAVLSAKINF
ncbi:MAG: TonB-dependent receptor [Gammaproteobacteria bacterium]